MHTRGGKEQNSAGKVMSEMEDILKAFSEVKGKRNEIKVMEKGN